MKRMWQGTAEKIEIIRRKRAEGKTYREIGEALGCTHKAAHLLALKYLSEEDRVTRAYQRQPVTVGVVPGFPRTQRRYRIDEWQAVMGGYSKCRYCNEEAKEAAHIVEDSKRNLAKYGFYAIYHRDNLIPTCRAHNSKAMNEARGQAGEEEHMARIIATLNAQGIDQHNGRKH